MIKKILTAALALTVALMFSITAFAQQNFSLDYAEVLIDENGNIIPVFGYIGSDPGETPIPEIEIYVELPVKILFAAFESVGENISSPKYTITNLSYLSDLKIEVTNFTQKNTETALLDGNLSLKLKDLNEVDIFAVVFPSDYQQPKLLTDRLPKITGDSQDNIFGFMVGGSWTGSFDKQIQPAFEMVLKISATQ